MIFGGFVKTRCHECPVWSEEMRKRKGCIGESEEPIITFDRVDYFKCPGRLVTSEVKQFLNIYALCKAFNKFPVSGGVLDQTNQFIQAVGIVESEILKQQNIKDAKDKMGWRNSV